MGGLMQSMGAKQGNWSYGSGQNPAQQAVEYNLAKNSGSQAFQANRTSSPGYDNQGNATNQYWTAGAGLNGPGSTGKWMTPGAAGNYAPAGPASENTNRYEYKGQTGLDQNAFMAAASADSGPGGPIETRGYGNTGLPGGAMPIQNQGRAFQRTPTPGLRNVMAGPAPTPVQPGNDIWGGGGDQMQQQGLESMQQNSGLSPALKALFGM